MGRAVPLALLLATAAVAAAAAVPACVPPSSVLSVATDRCCLDQAHTIDPDSSPAYIAGVLAHLSYPTSFPELPMNCSDACVDFQAPFAAVAQAMGATDVAFVNGAEDHLNAMVVQTNSTVWLVFRGTEWPTLDPRDIFQDTKTNLTQAKLAGRTVGVHTGMWEDLTEVYPELVAQLRAFGAGADRDLVITGHSLGATLSGLTAARLAAVDGLNASAVYTWATSRGGDKRFAELYRELGLHDKTLRFSNLGDVVPLGLPPKLVGYHHVGQLVTVANGTCTKPDADAEEVDYCAVAPGVAAVTAREKGTCRDVLLPYMDKFCGTPKDKLGGRDQLQAFYNDFMWDLFCEKLWTGVTKPSLLTNPNWCCMLEYALERVNGSLEDMIMLVGQQHGMPSMLAHAKGCLGDGDAAQQVNYCMEANPDTADLLASL